MFASRASTGVRGVRLAEGDSVVSLCILNHLDATPDERAAYLKRNRAGGEEAPDEAIAGDDEENAATITLPDARFFEMQLAEQILLTVTSKGFGKRVSSYDYRLTNGADRASSTTATVAGTARSWPCSPVTPQHQIMLVTNTGQIIRCPVEGIRLCSRSSLGVTLFRVGDGEDVVSVAAIEDSMNGETQQEETHDE